MYIFSSALHSMTPMTRLHPFDPELDAQVQAALELDTGVLDTLRDLGIFNGMGIDIRALSQDTIEMLDDHFGA